MEIKLACELPLVDTTPTRPINGLVVPGDVITEDLGFMKFVSWPVDTVMSCPFCFGCLQGSWNFH